VLPFAWLADVNRNGVTARELAGRYRDLDTAALRADRDRLVAEAITDNIPPGIFNTLVYTELGRKDLDRAKEYALLQVLVAPSEANAWDTLGEVHWFRGETDVARAYEKHSRIIDSGFTTGGVTVWEKDLADHLKKWAEAN
jgi:hypothetical protein